MTTTFEQRGQSFEAKFHHDLDLGFRVAIRRDKLLGLWAAELMEMPDAAAKAYAAELVDTECTPHRDSFLQDKVQSDLRGAGIDMSDHRLERRMLKLTEEARRQVMAEEDARMM